MILYKDKKAMFGSRNSEIVFFDMVVGVFTRRHIENSYYRNYLTHYWSDF